MSKQPKRTRPVTSAPAKAEKKSPVLYLRLTESHERALDEYIRRQKAKPDRQAVGLAALESFLQQEGLWPPGK